MQFERWVDLNLDKGCAAHTDLGTLYEGDTNALKLGVRLYDSSGPVDVTGTVSGWAITADGTTLTPFSSTGKSDNEAWIVLPQAALFPGHLQVYLQITDTGHAAVTLDATATVKRTATSSAATPGTPIPNVTQLEEAAQACQTATAAAQAFVDDWSVATVSETKTHLGIT